VLSSILRRAGAKDAGSMAARSLISEFEWKGEFRRRKKQEVFCFPRMVTFLHLVSLNFLFIVNKHKSLSNQSEYRAPQYLGTSELSTSFRRTIAFHMQTHALSPNSTTYYDCNTYVRTTDLLGFFGYILITGLN
jgi:hypothetical protein